MASPFTYLFADAVTNQTIAELPLTNVNFELAVNGAGTFSGDLLATDPRLAQPLVDWIDADQPGRTAVYVDLNGVLVWGGLLWTDTYTSSTRTVGLGGSEFFSWYDQRLLAKTYVGSFVNADPLVAAATIVNDANAAAGANGIGIVVGSQVSGLTTLTQDYPPGQIQTVGSTLTTLAGQGPDLGFDFAIDVAYSANVPTKTLNWSYPRRGRVAGTTGLVLDSATFVDYVWPRDASLQADSVTEVGSGSGVDMLQSVATNPNLLTAGYPLLERMISRSNVTNQALLNNLGAGDIALYANPVATPTITVPIDNDQAPLGSFIVGDDFRLIFAPDPRFPNGQDVYKRLVSCKVFPNEEGVSTMELTFNDPPVT